MNVLFNVSAYNRLYVKVRYAEDTEWPSRCTWIIPGTSEELK